jgi:hypothetical protein
MCDDRGESRRSGEVLTVHRSFVIRASIASALVVAALGCSDGPTAPTPVNQRFTLAPGESAQVSDAGLSVRFDGVTGDSRCPGDALCILGGDAVVHVTVLHGAATFAYELHTGSMQPVRYGELTLALEELQPYPFSSLPPIGPGDYRATIRATR